MSLLLNVVRKSFLAMLGVLFLLCAARDAFGAWQPGLQYGKIPSNALNVDDWPAVTNTTCEIIHAKTQDPAIWGTSVTWVYWGEMYFPETGTYWFGENNDDYAFLAIDGEQVFKDDVWDRPTIKSRQLNEGWHKIDLRLYNSGGGCGPVVGSGFTTTKGFGYAFSEKEITSGADLVVPEDSGDGTVFRYDDGKGFDDILVIKGEPVNYGNVNPPYGIHSGMTNGTALTCTAEPGRAIGGVAYRLSGYRLEDVDVGTDEPTNIVASGIASPVEYRHVGHKRLLTWLWEASAFEISVSSLVPEKGTVSGGGTFAPGAEVTLTATPLGENAFSCWTGDVPEGVDATSPTITFPVDRARDIVATFGTVVYVSIAGDDAKDGTSWGTAFASLEKAVEVAPDNSTIAIGPGEYALTRPDRLVIDKPVLVLGCGETSDDVVLKPLPNSVPGLILGVSNELAVVRHLTLAHAQRTEKYNSPGATDATALLLNQGTVEDCVIRDNDSGNGPVHVKGGLLDHCTLYGNAAGFEYTWTGYGGAIFASGGIVRDCVISNNVAHQGAAGIQISDTALVTGCLITGNKGRYQSVKIKGAGVVIKGGVLENSFIVNNGNDRTDHAGGIFMVNWGSGGANPEPIVRNCVVTGNQAIRCGGVAVERGKIVNCTILGNLSGSMERGVSLHQKGGVVRNNIILGASTAKGALFEKGTFENNLVDDESLVDSTVFTGDPLFVNPAEGDYRLRPGSAATDKGTSDEDAVLDMLGTSRPQGQAFDVGAYERSQGQGNLLCGFTVDKQVVQAPGTVNMTAFVDGGDLTGLVYSWDFDNDGTIDASGEQATWSDIPIGMHPVRLVVSTASGENAVFVKDDAVPVVAGVAYVSKEGSGIFPYATLETATSDVQAAIDTVWATDELPGKVIVKAGTYDIDGVYLSVNKPICLEGVDGAATTILKAVHAGTRRVMKVDNKLAVVSGLTMANGKWDCYRYGDSGPGGLRLFQGTVTNCIIRDNIGNDIAGGVEIIDGLLIDCRIYGNKSYRDSCTTVSWGGGIRLRGGLVSGCMISNNVSYQTKGNNATPSGGGVYITAGTLRDSWIVKNTCASADDRVGAGIFMEGGLVERCVIRDNFKCFQGGGAYIRGGVVRNCLIVGNEAKDKGGAVYLEKGTLEFCTLSGNKSTTNKGSGLYQEGGVARNNIIMGNGPGTAAEPTANLSYQGGTLTTNIVSPATAGVGNIDTDPLFANAAEDDYSPGAGSPAIDAAAEVEEVVSDIAGNQRPKDGDGDGIAASDIGCYEAPGPDEGPLRCSFSANSVVAFERLETTFTANVAGEGSKGEVHYQWDLGGGTTGSQGTDSQIVEAVFDGYGVYTISLTVTAVGKTATSTLENYVLVGSSETHVNANGQNVWPYATAETGATNIMEALDSMTIVEGVPNHVIVHDGTYEIRTKWLMLMSPIQMVSENGPEKTILKAANPEGKDMRRIAYIAHPKASVSGFTMTGGWWEPYRHGDSGPGAVRIAAGTLSDCIITNNTGADVAGGVQISGGLVKDCLIAGNKVYRGNNTSVGIGGGVRMTGGELVHCVISNNLGQACSGGVDIRGGVVRDCLITNNRSGDKSTDNRDYGGAYVENGVLENCVIRDNVANGNIGGVGVGRNGVVRNCLIGGNTAKKPCQALALGDASALAYNCTVASNGTLSVEGAVAAQLDKGTIANTIVYHNHVTDVATDAEIIAHHNCWPGAVGEGCIAVDPAFCGLGDFHLVGTSPCKNAGDNSVWDGIESPVDLDGNGRILFRIVDMGCYENKAGNATIFLLR